MNALERMKASATETNGRAARVWGMTAGEEAEAARIRQARYATPDADILALVDIVADATGVPREEILGRGRRARESHARQLVMRVAHRGGLSLEAIGRALGRHPTTVAHGISQSANRDEASPADGEG